MLEASLTLDCLIIALIVYSMARGRYKSEEVHQRLDDIIDGVGIFAREVLDRTEQLRQMAAPAIELHNHNPLEQIFNFLRGMQTGDFGRKPDDNITNPRDSGGRYAAAPQISQDPQETPEIIDITD